MSNPKVSRLTKEEINQAKSSEGAPVASVSTPAKNRADLYSTEYIKKLKLDEIEKFFERFDVVACAKIPNQEEPKFVYVVCKDFNVVFSDYSTVFDFGGGLIEADPDKKSTFDMQAFADYCTKTNQAPDNVIAKLMEIELFGHRFPSYAENNKKVKMEENRLAFEALPKSMRKTLGTANDAATNEIGSTFNKLYYGDFAGNPYLMGGENK